VGIRQNLLPQRCLPRLARPILREGNKKLLITTEPILFRRGLPP
jgi:hypothetical protein